MPADLSGKFRIVAEVKTKYARVRLVLNASNRQEGNVLTSSYQVSEVKLALKGMNFSVPHRKLSKSEEKIGTISLGEKEPSRAVTKIYVPSVSLGYDLEASFRLQDISIEDQDRYSGSFMLSYGLLGPILLPSFGEKDVLGSFKATRVT